MLASVRAACCIQINTSKWRAVQRIYRFPVGSSAALNLLFSKYQLSDAISHEKENTELAQFKEQCLCQEGGRSAGDESQLWRKFAENDKKCKLTSITAKAYISSLNSHFPLRELSTEFGSLISSGKVWSM